MYNTRKLLLFTKRIYKYLERLINIYVYTLEFNCYIFNYYNIRVGILYIFT